ncbi:hypothetical protein E2C01_022228 [Portunus trituberculatus]|uniref:Uncharacterized protein n=1 Tax=Portunus trituberculatus TaxID=210409 RepID=A0A5B7E4U0_PORTR|nr:hypothetical protein [Portunus trituberculatus]
MLAGAPRCEAGRPCLPRLPSLPSLGTRVHSGAGHYFSVLPPVACLRVRLSGGGCRGPIPMLEDVAGGREISEGGDPRKEALVGSYFNYGGVYYAASFPPATGTAAAHIVVPLLIPQRNPARPQASRGVPAARSASAPPTRVCGARMACRGGAPAALWV